MDIYIGIDKEEIEKFKSTAQVMTNKINQKKLGNLKSMKEYSKQTKGICILFSNRIKYLEEISEKFSGEIINVTDNLSSSHIVTVLKHVKDIYYLKADMDSLVNRLEARIQKLNRVIAR